MAKKEFKLRAKLVFSGEFLVKANSKQEAEEILKKNVGCNLGKVECSDNEKVLDWDIPMHGTIVMNKDYGKEVESEQ